VAWKSHALPDLNSERNELPAYRRVLLKLSGEAIAGEQGAFDLSVVSRIAVEIKKVYDLGVEIGIVIGGGNIVRGGTLEKYGFDRIGADSMGMLATLINSLLLDEMLVKQGVSAVVQSALAVETIVESVTLNRTRSYLEEGRVVLFAGGTGSPYFTTDTAAALRACEIDADVLLKATKVDGVYDRDPVQHRNATLYRELRYADLLEQKLRVMDMAAVSMCRDHHIPIVVFNLKRDHELVRVVQGNDCGTTIKE
jgi:uridylate kinase